MFDQLYEGKKRGELILIDGGLCNWHKRLDGQITIREIISTRPGAGTEMLEQLKNVDEATSIFAKCSIDLEANAWFAKKDFELEGIEVTKKGREFNLWRLDLS